MVEFDMLTLHVPGNNSEYLLILLNTMHDLVYKTPECRIVEVRIDTAFLGSSVITGYPGSDDPIIDEGELD